MEELEAMLASVKAWAKGLLESLGLCRKDCDALRLEKETLELEAKALKNDVANLQADLALERARIPLPEVPPAEKPAFDFIAILQWMEEFKQLAQEIHHSVQVGDGATQTRLDELVVFLTQRLKDLSGAIQENSGPMAHLEATVVAKLQEMSVRLIEQATVQEKIAAQLTALNANLASISSVEPVIRGLKAELEAFGNKIPANFGIWVNQVTVDLQYFREKLNRIPL